MLIGSMAASTTTVINLTWLPESLFFVAATAPSNIRVTVLGAGVIMDLDANGVTALSNIRGVNRVTNGFILELSNGIMTGKNVEISFTNTVAGIVPLYGYGERRGDVYVQSLRQALLANSGAVFTDFAVLSIPTILAADTIDVTYHDGHVQRFHRDEIQAMNMQKQNNLLSYVIDNLDGYITSVNVLPTAALTAYIIRFALKDTLENPILQ